MPRYGRLASVYSAHMSDWVILLGRKTDSDSGICASGTVAVIFALTLVPALGLSGLHPVRSVLITME